MGRNQLVVAGDFAVPVGVLDEAGAVVEQVGYAGFEVVAFADLFGNGHFDDVAGHFVNGREKVVAHHENALAEYVV